MQSYTWNLYWGGLVDLSVEGSLLVTVLVPTDFVQLFHELSREYLIKELFVKPHQARWRSLEDEVTICFPTSTLSKTLLSSTISTMILLSMTISTKTHSSMTILTKILSSMSISTRTLLWRSCPSNLFKQGWSSLGADLVVCFHQLHPNSPEYFTHYNI